MKIYLDVCCLNRVFEESDQERIRLERAAIEAIYETDAVIVTSEVVQQEIAATSDLELRTGLDALDGEANECVSH